MIQFVLLVIFSLTLAGRSTVKLLAGRFIDPTDLATISIVYYSVPLAMAGYMEYNYRGLVFLHTQAADPELAILSLRYVCLALIALEAGRFMGTALPPPSFKLSFKLSTQSTARAQIWFIALLGMMAGGVILFGIPEFLAGYATESFGVTAQVGNALVYSSAELLGFAMMLTLLIGKVEKRVPLKPWILLSLLALLALLVIRAKRLEIVTSLLPAAIVLFSNRPTLGTFRTRSIAIAVAVGLLVLVSVLRVSDRINAADFVYYALAEGLYASHSLSGVLARVDIGYVNYEYGARFISALLGFIPRFLWEGKDQMIYAGNEVLKGVSPLGATTFLSESVLQGGTVAVAVIYTVMGFAFERLRKFELVWDRGLEGRFLPLRFGAYLVSIVIFIPHFRDGIIPAIKLSMQSFFFFVLLVGLHYQTQAKPSRTRVVGA